MQLGLVIVDCFAHAGYQNLVIDDVIAEIVETAIHIRVCAIEISPCSLRHIRQEMRQLLVLVNEVGHVFHREELFYVLVNAPFVKLLVYAGTFGY